MMGWQNFIISAIENHAQLIRFVQRNQLSREDAARLAVEHAQALEALIDKISTGDKLSQEPTPLQQWPPEGREVNTATMDLEPDYKEAIREGLQRRNQEKSEEESKWQEGRGRLLALQKTLVGDPYLRATLCELQDTKEEFLLIRVRTLLERHLSGGEPNAPWSPDPSVEEAPRA